MQAPVRRAALPANAWVVYAAALGALLPLLIMILDFFSGQLGANPLQRSEQQSGVLALSLIMLSLACTPLRLLAARAGVRLLWPAKIRKTLGVWGAAYAGVHLLIYFLDKGFGPLSFLHDVLKRPYITVGLIAFLILIPLTYTSQKTSPKRLGFERWQRLHRLSYVVIALGVLHYWWSVKADHTGPLLALALMLVLFAVRVLIGQAKTRRAGRGPATVQPGDS